MVPTGTLFRIYNSMLKMNPLGDPPRPAPPEPRVSATHYPVPPPNVGPHILGILILNLKKTSRMCFCFRTNVLNKFGKEHFGPSNFEFQKTFINFYPPHVFLHSHFTPIPVREAHYLKFEIHPCPFKFFFYHNLSSDDYNSSLFQNCPHDRIPFVPKLLIT